MCFRFYKNANFIEFICRLFAAVLTRFLHVIYDLLTLYVCILINWRAEIYRFMLSARISSEKRVNEFVRV